MTQRYLILGASGFIGARLYAVLGPQRAVATCNKHRLRGAIPFDAAADSLEQAVLRDHRDLRYAFILLGISNIDVCARDPEGTAAVNVTGVKRVIDALLEHGILPVFASSDAVFDGSRGMWTEADTPGPSLTYGRHKLAVEDYLARRGHPYVVTRMSKVITTAPNGGGLLADWMDRLERGEDIRCASDQVFSPVDVDDVVDACIRLAEGGHTGIFHVCCPAPVSRLQLLYAVTEETARYRPLQPRIRPCSIRDFDFAEARPLDTSMSGSKLYAVLGRTFDDVRETCRRAVARRYRGRGTTDVRMAGNL